jgi:CubicO group peptidase (beta-lactamase class C family)
MTKLATSLACLQLVERGALSLDDPSYIKKHLPELWALPILTGIEDDGTEIKISRTQPLTLRHLLTHTCGLAYEFAHPLEMQYAAKHRAKSMITPNATVAELARGSPLLFEPGTAFAYGPGSDWAGILVQRASGLGLGEYFDKHIFGPVGIREGELTFYPTPEVKSRLMHMCGRTENGTGDVVRSRGWRNVAALETSDIGVPSGGAGLLGSLDAYLTLLRHVLGCRNPGGIITPQTWQLLFTNALPARTPATEEPHYESLGGLVALFGENTPLLCSGEGVGHSLACGVNTADSPHGRRAGSGFWLGAAQSHYWIDPATGIVVSVGCSVATAAVTRVTDHIGNLRNSDPRHGARQGRRHAPRVRAYAIRCAPPACLGSVAWP